MMGVTGGSQGGEWTHGIPFAQVNAPAMQIALAAVGWTQPSSGVPVLPWAVPVIIVGGDVVKYVTVHVASGAAVGAGVFSNTVVGAVQPVVPAGKQWKVVKAALQGGTAGVYPAFALAGAAAQVGFMHPTASTLTLNLWTVYPILTDANPQLPLAVLQAGDAIGIIGNVNGLTVGYDASFLIEEANAPA